MNFNKLPNYPNYLNYYFVHLYFGQCPHYKIVLRKLAGRLFRTHFLKSTNRNFCFFIINKNFSSQIKVFFHYQSEFSVHILNKNFFSFFFIFTNLWILNEGSKIRWRMRSTIGGTDLSTRFESMFLCVYACVDINTLMKNASHREQEREREERQFSCNRKR